MRGAFAARPSLPGDTEIQARRQMGLTATLIREDGRQDYVFALIGPKRYDVPWKTLESRDYIAEAICTEYRLKLPPDEERNYAHAEKRSVFGSQQKTRVSLIWPPN